MDGSAKEIVIDGDGVCNFCHQAQRELKLNGELRIKLPELLQEIMRTRGNYNCLIGLSGGVDSSFVLLRAVELGLKPLCFSIDNGWNDPKADENIMRLVEGLKVPFYRYTIDTKKFIGLQSAFMKAGQKNLEIPTDHILMATTYEVAKLYGIKYVLSGGNAVSESIMPPSWGYQARDLVHIKDIYRWATGNRLKGLPVCSLLKFNYYKWIKRIKVINFPDYFNYNRDEAIKELTEKFGWKSYGDKHQESVFTTWFQNFYLFEKFGIDKRKAHYSSLINSGQLERSVAMDLLTASPVYPAFGIEEMAMKYPKRDYTEFKTDEKLFNFLSKVIRKCRF